MCYARCVMYSSIKWMLDHLILYENFCSSSEFHSMYYFSACAISFFGRSSFLLLLCSFFYKFFFLFRFSFMHCVCVLKLLSFSSSLPHSLCQFLCCIRFTRLLWRQSEQENARERKKKNDWCLCSSIYFPLHKCISQAFIRSLWIVNKFFRTPFAYYNRFWIVAVRA